MTGLAPFLTMGIHSAMRMTMACQQMSQLVKQCPIHLLLRDLTQGGIKPNLVSTQDGDSGRCPQAGVPTGRHQVSQDRIEATQCLAYFFLKKGIPCAATSGTIT